MTTRNPTQEPRIDVHLTKWIWTGLLNGDDGAPLGGATAGANYHRDHAVYGDRSVQITGTLGAGGTIVIEGSNDGGVTWATLNDAFGNALTLTALGIKQITECVGQIRPRVTAGDGTTNLNVYLWMRKVVAE